MGTLLKVFKTVVYWRFEFKTIDVKIVDTSMAASKYQDCGTMNNLAYKNYYILMKTRIRILFWLVWCWKRFLPLSLPITFHVSKRKPVSNIHISEKCSYRNKKIWKINFKREKRKTWMKERGSNPTPFVTAEEVFCLSIFEGTACNEIDPDEYNNCHRQNDIGFPPLFSEVS